MQLRSQMTKLKFIFLNCALLLSGSLGFASDWPQWRGPSGDGVSVATQLPLSWSETNNVRWKCALPEWGNSTPVVSGNAIFLTAHVNGKTLQLLRIDKKTGTIVWTRDVGEGVATVELQPAGGRGSARFHRDHNLASPSPVTDGSIVAVHFGNGDLAVYDFDGKQLWKLNLSDDHGPFTTWWGRANSPVIYKDLIISVCMQDSCDDILDAPSPSYVVAHNTLTGKEAWKTMRMTGAKRAVADSYITPIFRQVNGATEMIVAGGSWLDAYDPQSGKQLWVLPGLKGNELSRNPIASKGMIYISQANNRAMSAIEPTGKGTLKRDTIAWGYGYAAWNSPSPVVWKNRLYMVDNNGLVHCIDTGTGKKVWKNRLEGNYRSAPIVANNHIYFLNTTGHATVIAAAADTFTKIAENSLTARTYASPVVTGNALLIRSRLSLYYIEKQ